MQSEFGKLMRKHRRAAEKTFADVAAALECSVGYVADVESGRRAPLGDEKLEVLAQVIAVPLKELKRAAVLCRGAYTLTVSKNASPKAFETGAALSRDFGSLNDDQLAEILRVLTNK
jgi:transcriptional regulator with XRE-family HTH domain